ncbi:LysR family transcriptional regulator [Kaustia mangrovi]|uniref:LysR family transcriptional regulator n=1 Tax=Kaustia mangrovi TaxID=2593653 RepID=A0A7S8C219_9HYPH|nr:LysR family transcriptional regulator [Kaustia mangrovi]QPC41906.1 LysR family transcriptional regulator [Kaustia mangrovi]
MPKKLERRDANIEQAAETAPPPDWDDIRLFVTAAEARSLRKAAERLRMSSSTIVRRIDKLEYALQARLFDRLPDGVELTPAGLAILQHAKRMESSSFELQRAVQARDTNPTGLVRVSITEGLGTYWVAPRLVELQRTNPKLVIELKCAMESADVLRMEADIAVQFTRPTNPDLKVTKLGRLHVYPFASKEYIATYGMPRSREDILNHRLIDQYAPQLEEGVAARFLGIRNPEGIVGMRTNASTAHYHAVEKGAGIGGLATYAAVLSDDLVAIDVGFHHHVDIWMTYHPDVRQSTRVSIMIDWLKETFSPQRFPWFRDEFIHPRELRKLPADSWKINLVNTQPTIFDTDEP